MKKSDCTSCKGTCFHNKIIIGQSQICPECGGTGKRKGQGSWIITSQDYAPNRGIEVWENTQTKTVAKHLILPGIIRTFISWFILIQEWKLTIRSKIKCQEIDSECKKRIIL